MEEGDVEEVGLILLCMQEAKGALGLQCITCVGEGTQEEGGRVGLIFVVAALCVAEKDK